MYCTFLYISIPEWAATALAGAVVEAGLLQESVLTKIMHAVSSRFCNGHLNYIMN